MAKSLFSSLILGPPIFFVSFSSTLRHCSKLSYYEFKAKLKKQTWENGEKPNFGPDFSLFSPIFFRGFYPYQILDIVASYHRMHFFFFPSKIWLRQSLSIIMSYHHVQYQKKLKMQSWEDLVTEGQTDKQKDRREWFHRTLSN